MYIRIHAESINLYIEMNKHKYIYDWLHPAYYILCFLNVCLHIFKFKGISYKGFMTKNQLFVFVELEEICYSNKYSLLKLILAFFVLDITDAGKHITCYYVMHIDLRFHFHFLLLVFSHLISVWYALC